MKAIMFVGSWKGKKTQSWEHINMCICILLMKFSSWFSFWSQECDQYRCPSAELDERKRINDITLLHPVSLSYCPKDKRSCLAWMWYPKSNKFWKVCVSVSVCVKRASVWFNWFQSDISINFNWRSVVLLTAKSYRVGGGVKGCTHVNLYTCHLYFYEKKKRKKKMGRIFIGDCNHRNWFYFCVSHLNIYI